MDFKPQEILQVAAIVWEATLGVTIEPAESTTPPDATICSVRIDGAWHGAIVLECSREVAKLAAASMFGTSADKMAPADLQDAIAELANMVGGNLKGLLPETCSLSLPMSVSRTEYSEMSSVNRLLGRVGFVCNGHAVSIVVLERIERNCAAA